MIEENEGDREKYYNDDDQQIKHELYGGKMNFGSLEMVEYGGATMGQVREKYDFQDPLDRLVSSIFYICAGGIAFGLLLIWQNIM